MEWDTGAAHAIVLESDCSFKHNEGSTLKYNKPSLVNKPFVVYAKA
jgi:3'-phosphoadenosine 5'-phosphosulfate (PAPS) 3'-phosphatase